MVINRVRKKKILSLDEILVITILMEAEKSEGECGFRKKLIPFIPYKGRGDSLTSGWKYPGGSWWYHLSN